MSDTPKIEPDTSPEEPSSPPSKRHLNRIAAMQFLYMFESNHSNDREAALATFFEKQEQPRPFYAFAETLICGALEHLDEVDITIRQLTQNWDFARIAKVDLAILRLGLYELLYRRDIPPVVSINEAIDLSKAFSGPDSSRFINGLLDQFKASLKRPLRSAADQ